MITDYTSYNDIRAVLGASIDELPDSSISLLVHENAVRLALLSITGTLAPDTVERNLEEHYDYLSGLTTLTTDQNRLKLSIETYVTYIAADSVAGSLSTALPKIQADGKSSLTRFSDIHTYMTVQARIKDSLGATLAAINSLFGVATEISSTFVKSIAPAVDKVTGE